MKNSLLIYSLQLFHVQPHSASRNSVWLVWLLFLRSVCWLLLAMTLFNSVVVGSAQAQVLETVFRDFNANGLRQGIEPTTMANNDVKVDAGLPCINLTTGEPGYSNQTYDFGMAKDICSLTATASAATTICSGQSATLTATATGGTPGYSYAWQPSATLSGTNTATAVAAPTATTAYTMIVTDARNCTALATVTVTVGATPSFTATSNSTTVCSGELLSYAAFVQTAPNTTYSIYATMADAEANINRINLQQAFSISATMVYYVRGREQASNCISIQSLMLAPVNCQVSHGSIGNFVWKDYNNNGLQDPAEPGQSGIRVELFTVVDSVISNRPSATTSTNADGFYSFMGLVQGDYQVKFTLPASLTDSYHITNKPNSGDEAGDSDIDPDTGLSPVITIDTTQPDSSTARNNIAIDLGLQLRIYDPTGYIYCYETNTILTGGRISVSGPGSVSITKDGSDGSYQFFTDGTPGSYTLTYSHPDGYSIAALQRPVAASAIDPTTLEGTPADLDGLVNGWVHLGSMANSMTSPTALADDSAAANPYYLVFEVEAGDPYVSGNNLPVDCTKPCPPGPCIPIAIRRTR